MRLSNRSSIMKSVDVHRLNTTGLFSFLVFLSLLLTSQVVGQVSLPLNYEADALPASPWYKTSPFSTGASVSDSILTMNKSWSGEPHMMYKATGLEFTSTTGVIIETYLKLGSSNNAPVWLSVTDENLYFAYFFIYSNRIQRHQQNSPTPDETDYADFTQWRTLKIDFKSRHLKLYLDSQLIMDCDITGTYVGDYAQAVTFGIPGGGNAGPAQVQFDYIRISQGEEEEGVLVHLVDDIGQPLGGEDVKVQPAYGGSWGPTFTGVTETDGSFRCGIEAGYTKIRMTFNQASVQQTVAELEASGYTWTTVPAMVKVVDYQGQGISGVKISQGGSMWVDHGYTDGTGELGLYLFPDHSYKFRVSGSSVSNSSQIEWFSVPGPIQFQAGYVVSAGMAVRGSIGGAWVPYTPPGMHVLPGTYNFVFSSPTPSPQSINVAVGTQTNIP